MGWAERALIVVLRAAGVLMLAALAPVCFPFAWMDAIHRGLGMGPLPQGPIVGYLARSLSAFYAMQGALFCYVSFDPRRHLGVIQCLAVLGIAFGLGMLVVDPVVGMPFWWVLSEGPSVIALGAAILYLANQIDQRDNARGSAEK